MTDTDNRVTPLKTVTSILTATIAVAGFSANAENQLCSRINYSSNTMVLTPVPGTETFDIDSANRLAFVEALREKSYKNRYKKIGKSAAFKSAYYNKSIGDVIKVED